MMKATLTNKLLRLILPLLVLPIMLIVAFFYMYLLDMTEKNAIKLSTDITKHVSMRFANTPDFMIETQRYVDNNVDDNIPDITILDNDLNILAARNKENIGKLYAQDNIVFKQWVKESLLNKKISLFSDTKKEFIAIPLLGKNKKIAGFSVCNYKNNLQKNFAIVKQAFLFILLIVLFIVFIAIVLTIVFAFNIINPIKSLISGTQIVSTGNLSHVIEVISDDEIGTLTISFNAMVKKLRAAEDALKDLNQNLEEKVYEELKKSRDKDLILIQQSKMATMGEMLANIAHQWRQPLNALGLLIQNIELRHQFGELDEAAIVYTVKKGNEMIISMSQTIDDFSDFFRPNKKSESFSLYKNVEGTLRIIEPNLKRDEINIIQEIDQGASIYGYPNEFSQVLMNLINNAKDALLETNPVEKYIRIRVYEENGYVYLTVSDNAGGIPASIIDKVFDPYFTTKEVGKGTGLGLYMSKMIIETNMEGTLNVKNTMDGAQFTIIMKSKK